MKRHELGRLLRESRTDIVVALAVLLVQVVGAEVWARGAGANRPDAIGYALLLVVTAPLAVRNRYPVAALAVVTSAIVALIWLAQPWPFWIVALVLAIWAAVAAGHRRATIVIGVAFVATFLVAGATLRAGHAIDPDAPLWLVGWLVASFILGEVSRSRREYVEQVEQRAIDAERTREEEARRRAGEERLRIARELHDVLAHSISVINVQAGVAVHLLDKQPDQARTALVAISQASKEAMQELRATLGVLRQVDDVEPRAPAPGLAGLGDLLETGRAAGLEVSLETTGEPRPLPPATDLAAYRIVQESLTNVTRHAGASRVSVTIRHAPRDVEITVEDDGAGLVPGATLRLGNGLTGMRERAAAAGGELEAGPRPSGGFRVWARLPSGGGG
jgi:signal transduction histidine kinase